MARYRLTKSAKSDIGSILRTSEERHGRDARSRYAALLGRIGHHGTEFPVSRATRVLMRLVHAEIKRCVAAKVLKGSINGFTSPVARKLKPKQFLCERTPREMLLRHI